MSLAVILIIIFLLPAIFLLVAGLIQYVMDLVGLGWLLRERLGGKGLVEWLWDQLLYAGFSDATKEEPAPLTIYWWQNAITGAINWLADKIITALNGINITVSYQTAQVGAALILLAAMAGLIYIAWRVIT